uniref:Antimicrobial/opiod peptide Pv_1.2 n=1 Tax=Trachycephalus venulosus TaxID=213803 RepID=Q719L7_9NEOB|nr:antimicrobial/opiod peptide Pv_1.2 [Trachycephalus venulosus]
MAFLKKSLFLVLLLGLVSLSLTHENEKKKDKKDVEQRNIYELFKNTHEGEAIARREVEANWRRDEEEANKDETKRDGPIYLK